MAPVVFQIVDSLVGLLTSAPKPQDILAYKIPPDMQSRVSFLLEQNREGRLSTDQKEELDQFVFLEHVFRLAKARARIQIAQISQAA